MRTRERAKRPAGPHVLVAEKLHGVRRWEVSVDGDGRLRLGRPAHWMWETDGKPTSARCLRHSRADHRAPRPRCECGLYSVHPWLLASDDWRDWLPPDRQLAVAGIVEVWGTVVLHREGLRAEQARPLCLAVVGASLGSGYGRFVRQLADAHRAEVRRFASVAAISRYCARSRLGLDRAAVHEMLGLEPGDPADAA